MRKADFQECKNTSSLTIALASSVLHDCEGMLSCVPPWGLHIRVVYHASATVCTEFHAGHHLLGYITERPGFLLLSHGQPRSQIKPGPVYSAALQGDCLNVFIISFTDVWES